MNEDVVKISATDGGEFSALLVEPDPTAGREPPGIVLIQEIYGVNDSIRAVASDLADKGYRVCAPDLFWRLEPEVVLDPENDQDRARAKELAQGIDRAMGLEDCKSVAAYLRRGSRKVGVVGLSIGGRIAYHMAVGPHVDACVGYYPTEVHTVLDQSKHITAPVLLHIAEKDHLCDEQARFLIYEVLGPNHLVDLHTYSGAGHAFARIGGRSYHEEAATLANRRTNEFLRLHLL